MMMGSTTIRMMVRLCVRSRNAAIINTRFMSSCWDDGVRRGRPRHELFSTDAAATTPATNPKIEELFEKMIALSNDERKLVGKVLSQKLDLPIPDFSAAAYIPTDDPDDEEAAAVVVEEKTVFDLRLVGFDAKAKIKVIKEVRAIAGLGLKEAKELVEAAPTVIQKDLKREQAEELQKKLEEIGATIEIV